MKNFFLILITFSFLFLAANSKAQYKGGSFDGYVSILDSNILYPVGIKQIESNAEDYLLYQNYPNPFNPYTYIQFSLYKSSNVNLNVFDITGKLVRIILNNVYLNSGVYNINFDGSNLSSGIYFYHIVIHSDNIIAGNNPSSGPPVRAGSLQGVLSEGMPSHRTGQVFTDTKKMILNK